MQLYGLFSDGIHYIKIDDIGDTCHCEIRNQLGVDNTRHSEEMVHDDQEGDIQAKLPYDG